MWFCWVLIFPVWALVITALGRFGLCWYFICGGLFTSIRNIIFTVIIFRIWHRFKNIKVKKALYCFLYLINNISIVFRTFFSLILTVIKRMIWNMRFLTIVRKLLHPITLVTWIRIWIIGVVIRNLLLTFTIRWTFIGLLSLDIWCVKWVHICVLKQGF